MNKNYEAIKNVLNDLECLEKLSKYQFKLHELYLQLPPEDPLIGELNAYLHYLNQVENNLVAHSITSGPKLRKNLLRKLEENQDAD